MVLLAVDRDVSGLLVRLELNKYASPTEHFKREYHSGSLFSQHIITAYVLLFAGSTVYFLV